MQQNQHLVRSWKDPDFRSSLSAHHAATLSANPAGLIELTDEELMGVDGGTSIVCASVVISVISVIASAVGGCFC
jgi:mersacidin/lichenicidin family type 2 lantibiotic